MRHTFKRGFLTAAFGVAAAALGVAAAPLAITSAAGIGTTLAFGVAMFGFSDGFWNLMPVSMPTGTRAPLSKDEISLLKSVFGRKLATADLKKVRKYFRPSAAPTLAAVFNRRVAVFYGAAQQEKDYSTTAVAMNFGTFMHEMTHIWQRTSITAAFIRTFRRTRKYDYKLTKRSRFSFFGVEQQASIMEDYARRFLYPHGDVPAAHIDTTPENDALLQKVVERKFPAARKARLALAEKKRAQTRPEAREKFLRDLGRDTLATLTRWTQEPGSKFLFNTDLTEHMLAIGTNLPGKLGLTVSRDGNVDMWQFIANGKLQHEGRGTLTDMQPLLETLRGQAEKAGLLRKTKTPAPSFRPAVS